jgi:hypothetical protein
VSGESMESGAPGSGKTVVVPHRRDGTPRSWWFDPDCPGHIIHRDTFGGLHMICVGHDHR